MVENGFSQFNIAHLSPSQVNTFLACPGYWASEKIFGRKTKPGAAMHRGIVVEDAVAAVLSHGQSTEDATGDALKAFDNRVTGGLADTTKERDAIPAMVEQALAGLEGYGVPVPPPEGERQHKIELKCGLDDGTAIPFIGYLDFAFGGNRLEIIDLKTTHRCPSTMSFAHQIQRCIYQAAAADGWAVSFLYVTGKKHALLADGDTEAVLACVKSTANRMNELLKAAGTRDGLRKLVHVNPSDFRWSSPEALQIRQELYGF